MRELNFPSLAHKEIFENNEKVNVEDDIVMINNLQDIPPFFEPFSPQYGILTFVKKGWVKGRFNNLEIQVNGGETCIIPANTIIALDSYSDDAELTTFLFTNSKIGKAIQNQRPVKYLLELYHNPIVKNAPEVWSLVLDGVKILEDISRSQNQPNRLELMYHTFNMLFDMVCKPKLYEERPSVGRSRAEHLFEAFVREVKAHISHSHKVKFYADLLCITPNYLLKVCNRVGHTTPQAVINSLVILQAKHLLLNHKELSIQEIADKLGFTSQGFFANFFRREVGITPSEYQFQ